MPPEFWERLEANFRVIIASAFRDLVTNALYTVELANGIPGGGGTRQVAGRIWRYVQGLDPEGHPVSVFQNVSGWAALVEAA